MGLFDQSDLDEIKIKLGVDHSQVKPDMDDYVRKVSSGVKEAEKGVKGTLKELKREIKEIAHETSPLLGVALKSALSPVAGTLALASVAAAGFSKILEEINTRLDGMRDRNGRAFGNAGAAASAVASRIQEINSGHSAFVASQLAHGNAPGEIISEGIGKIESFFRGGNAPFPVEVQEKQSVLSGAKIQFQKKADALLGEINGLEKDSKNPAVQRGIANAKSQLESIKGEIAELEKREPQLNEEQAAREKYNPYKNFGINWGELGREFKGMLGLPNEDPKEELERLKNLRERAKQLEEALRNLTAIDKQNNDELKRKQDTLAGVLEQIRKMEKEISALPKTELVPGMMNLPLGPLFPQIPVFMPSARLAPGNLNQGVINGILQRLQEALNQDGVPVSINVKE